MPAGPPGMCRSHIPEGITFHSKKGGGDVLIGASSRGPPAETGRAGGPLNDIRENMAAWDGAVPRGSLQDHNGSTG